jgi:c-di-GMP-binding flagellar brake protein YcgR
VAITANTELPPETPQSPSTSGPILSRYVTRVDEIRQVFKLFRDQRSDLGLQIAGEDQTFTAHVLDVTGADLLLEDMRPREGFALLNEGRSFNLTGRSEGVFMYAESLLLVESLSERGVPYFRVTLPEKMLYQQRRRAARFRIPLRVATHGAEVVMRRETGAISGAIVDISVGGCRATFTGFPYPGLEVDEHVDMCQINIPKLLNLTAEGSVRHVAYDKEHSSTTCGIEFIEMDITDRRRLEQFVQTLAKAGKR